MFDWLLKPRKKKLSPTEEFYAKVPETFEEQREAEEALEDFRFRPKHEEEEEVAARISQELWERGEGEPLTEEEKKQRVPKHRLIEAMGEKGAERYLEAAEIASKEKAELAAEGVTLAQERAGTTKRPIIIKGVVQRDPETGEVLYETTTKVTPGETPAEALARVRKARAAAQEAKYAEMATRPEYKVAIGAAKVAKEIGTETVKAGFAMGTRMAARRGSLGARAGVVTPIAPSGFYSVSALRNPDAGISGMRHPGMDLSGMKHTLGPSMSPSMLTGSGLASMRTSVIPVSATLPHPLVGTRTGAQLQKAIGMGIQASPERNIPGMQPGERIIKEVDYPVWFWMGKKQGWERGGAVITQMRTGTYRFIGTGQRAGQPRSKMIGKEVGNAPYVAEKRGVVTDG